MQYLLASYLLVESTPRSGDWHSHQEQERSAASLFSRVFPHQRHAWDWSGEAEVDGVAADGRLFPESEFVQRFRIEDYQEDLIEPFDRQGFDPRENLLR
jgi:hypothetical protein